MRHSSGRILTVLKVSSAPPLVIGCPTYSCSLPCLMVEKDITAPFSFRTYGCWIGEGLVLGQPHHELFVISPISSGTSIVISRG